jgi:hypothetical protein
MEVVLSNSKAEVRCFATSAFGIDKPLVSINYDPAREGMLEAAASRLTPFMVADPFIFAALGDVTQPELGIQISELL